MLAEVRIDETGAQSLKGRNRALLVGLMSRE
jgi:hypothetical protein